MTPTTLTAQALVAVTGIFPRRPPSVREMRAATGMPARWRARLHRWLNNETRVAAEWRYLPPPDMDELQKKIITPPDREEIEGWLASVGEVDVGIDYLATITKAREYVDGQWPKIPMDGIQAETCPLSRDEREQIWSIVRVLDDADALFDDFESRALVEDQVAAWRTVFPDLAALIDDILADLLIEHVAKKKDLAWWHEDGVRLLRGLPLAAPFRVEAPAPGEAQAPERARPIEFRSLRTETERLESRST